MDPKIVIYFVLFLLLIPRFISVADAQVNQFMAYISDTNSFEGERESSQLIPVVAEPAPERNTMSAFGNIPDTAAYAPEFTAVGLPVYGSSLLMMIQGLLSKQEIILEYFPSDTVIRLIVVTKDSAGIYTLKAGQKFRKEMDLFQRKLKLADFGDLREQSTSLSGVLLGKVKRMLKEKNRAVIIAHGNLHGFPFEALVCPANGAVQRGRNTTYLVEKLEIVYNNSILHWLNNRIASQLCKSRANAEKSLAFAGFSPGFEYHECIQQLHAADEEISTIGRMFREKGKAPVVLLDENSNETTFRSVSRFCHILHLATHTISSEEFPEMNGLLFHEFGSDEKGGSTDDGLLAVHEICDLHITADLIVLDACASANLKSRKGMDWFSYADCFMKAGARNVLGTLWNVTDHFAEKFMVDFYRYYLAGMTFSKALQKVKIRMINEPATSLPVNWAAYVLIGE